MAPLLTSVAVQVLSTTGRAFNRPLVWFIPFAIGLLFAWFHVGPRAAFTNHNETNAKYQGDSLTHLTGLNYFVQDEWRFPLLDAPDLGFAAGGGNIIYTDSLPLLALPAKLLHKLQIVTLPDYFGFWLFLCVVLQPVAFCWVLDRAGRLNVATAVFGSLIALAVPAFLARYSHITLCSHFLLLFSIGAYLEGRRHHQRGSALLALLVLTSLLVTAYLFAMVLGFFAVHLAQAWTQRRIGLARAVSEGAVVMLLIMSLAILLGYWNPSHPTSKASGYGLYSMNLLSPLWPHNSTFFHWLPSSPDPTEGQYEGFNYMGLGLLIGIATVACRRPATVSGWGRRHPWLVLYLVFLVILALSHIVYAGSRQILHLELNHTLYGVLSQFRAAGRMFWPVTYVAAVAVVAESSRWTGGWRFALPVLALLQLVDVAAYIGRPTYSGTLSEHRNVVLGAMEELVGAHDRMYLLPSYGRLPVAQFATSEWWQHLASRRRVPVHSAYMSRWFSHLTPAEVDFRSLNQPLDPDALYVGLPPLVDTAGFVAGFGFEVIDRIRRLDQALVLSSRWSAVARNEILRQLPAAELPRIDLNTIYLLDGESDATRLLFGHFAVTDGLVWMDARSAGIVGRVNPAARHHLVLQITAATFVPAHLERTARVFVNGIEVGSWRIPGTEGGLQVRRMRIPPETVDATGDLIIEWSFDDLLSPADAGLDSDPRLLGFLLQDFGLLAPEWTDRSYQETIRFSEAMLPASLNIVSGFSGAENWGRWTDGTPAVLEVAVDPRANSVELAFDTFAFLPPDRPTQQVTVSLGNSHKADWNFSLASNHGRRTLRVAQQEIPADGLLRLQFEIAEPRSPSEFGNAQDPRQLGIGFETLRIDVSM